MDETWLRGPQRRSSKGDLWVGGEPIVVNPAFRFGVRQADMLRAVDDLERSSTCEATYFKTPINLLIWGHVAQICVLFDLEEGRVRELWPKLIRRTPTRIYPS